MKRLKPYYRSILILLATVLAVTVSIGLWHWQTDAHKALTDGRLQIHVLDVGQGDCTLLILPTGERILIDTGTEESGETILAHLAEWKVGALDLIILSHNHDDHAGGLRILADAIPIGGILYTGQAPQSYGLPTRTLSAGECFSVGDLNCTILGPLSPEEEDNRSMILRMEYGQMSFLFTGDTEAPEEALLLATNPALLDVDFLKVAHHGSDTSTTEAFLAAVTPKVAVISVSDRNSFGHPSPTVCERLKGYHCTVYRTDREGDVIFLTDGTQLIHYHRD